MIGDPISERIVQEIVDTLSQVRQASGFFTDLIVERENQEGNSPRDNLVVVCLGDLQSQKISPMGFDEFLMPVGLIYYAIEPTDSAISISQRLQRGAADIRKALAADLHRGGLAINTEMNLHADDYFASASPYSVLIKPMIRFRTLWNNPYKQY